MERDRAYNVTDVLKDMAEQKHVSAAQRAVARLPISLRDKRIEQLSDNLGAVDIVLSEEDVRPLDQVSQFR